MFKQGKAAGRLLLGFYSFFFHPLPCDSPFEPLQCDSGHGPCRCASVHGAASRIWCGIEFTIRVLGAGTDFFNRRNLCEMIFASRNM